MDQKRTANTVAVLNLQGYVLGDDGVWHGEHYDARIEDGFIPKKNAEDETYFILYTWKEVTGPTLKYTPEQSAVILKAQKLQDDYMRKAMSGLLMAARA
jgi:hypothetical protein